MISRGKRLVTVNSNGSRLRVVMYHYVRDLPRTRFPRLKGILTDDFRCEVSHLAERYEMASLESTLDFLSGRYQPKRDLCLLTFDDGLNDHYSNVLPILSEQRVQGVFFVITSCPEEGRMVSVHKSHLLMAALNFDDYRREVMKCLSDLGPVTKTEVDSEQARQAYRWDPPPVAGFKYLMNFVLPRPLRETILDLLFARFLGDEGEFSKWLYMGWDQARELQSNGMVIGGHSHNHLPLATMTEDYQRKDLETCSNLLHERLRYQRFWPFSYPYGKGNTFNSFSVDTIRSLGFACGFATDVGVNEVNTDLFRLNRIDPKDVLM